MSDHLDLEAEAADYLAYAASRPEAAGPPEVALTMALQACVRAFVREQSDGADLNHIEANNPALTKARRSLMIALATVCFTPGTSTEGRRKQVIQLTHDITLIAGHIDQAFILARAGRGAAPN